jgi:HEAT repeat protein
MRSFPALAALLIFALPAHSQSTLERDIEKAVERLYSEKGNESDLAREELESMGRRAAPRLVQELTGKGGGDRKPNARVRRLLCEILGALRDPSPATVDALADKLTDTEEYGLSVAAAAAHALGEIADERAVPALLKALNSKAAESDRWLKHSTIWALGVLRAKDAAPAIQKALEDKGSADIGGYSKRHLIRATAADALGLIGAKEAVDGIGKLLNDTDDDPASRMSVQVHAARALERILGTNKGALSGSAEESRLAVEAWKKWWTTEETRKNVDKVKGQLAEIGAALEKFKAKFGKYPEILGYLKTKPVGDDYKNYPDGGFYAGDFNDPWGKAIIYSSKNENGAPFDLVSYGRDGLPWGGGDDADIWNHDAYIPLRTQKSRDAIKQVDEAIGKYKADSGGKLPASLMDLTKPLAPDKNGGKAYLESLPKDGFGFDLRYAQKATEGAEYDLKSLGSDNKEGGVGIARDVWNHEHWIPVAVKKTREQLKTIGEAVEKFRKEQDRYPEELENLKVKPVWAKSATMWPKENYTSAPLTDGFGNPLSYKVVAGGKPEIKSLGADGVEGGTGADEDLK